jgi:N-acetylneuraminic acid mutarotase
VAVDGMLYGVGGYRSGTAVADFARFDPATASWETLPDLPEPRDHLVAAAVDGVVYAVGGRGGAIEAHSPSVFSFDPAEGAWRTEDDMPTSRGGAAGAVVGGVIFVVGGEGNPDDDTGVLSQTEGFVSGAGWSRHAPMPTPRHGTGAAAIGGRMSVPGGATTEGFGAVDVHEVFVPE